MDSAHFWALAILLKDDYSSVGIPMLPSVKGSVVTVKAISRYGWATILMSIFGVLALPEGGLLYGIMLLPYNGRLLQLINRLKESPDDLKGERSIQMVNTLYVWNLSFIINFKNSTFGGIWTTIFPNIFFYIIQA